MIGSMYMMEELFIRPKSAANYADLIFQQQSFQAETSYSFDSFELLLTLFGANLYSNYKLKKEVILLTRNENS